MKRAGERAIDELTARGFEFVRQNTKGARVYARAGVEVMVTPSCDDDQARAIMRRIGVDGGKAKRNVAAVRDRAAAERERAAHKVARLDHERAAILAAKARALGGVAARLTEAEVRAIERRIVQIDAETSALRLLMTERPAPVEHRAHHRAGQ